MTNENFINFANSFTCISQNKYIYCSYRYTENIDFYWNGCKLTVGEQIIINREKNDILTAIMTSIIMKCTLSFAS